MGPTPAHPSWMSREYVDIDTTGVHRVFETPPPTKVSRASPDERHVSSEPRLFSEMMIPGVTRVKLFSG